MPVQEKKKGSRCLLLPPFIHLPLLLCPVSATLYALCIKKKKKRKALAHTSTVKIKEEVIKKPALIYTTVFVLRLISEHSHQKLIASVTWLSLQS